MPARACGILWACIPMGMVGGVFGQSAPYYAPGAMDAPRVRSIGFTNGPLGEINDALTFPDFVQFAKDPASVPSRDFSGFYFGASGRNYGENFDLSVTMVYDSTSNLEAQRFWNFMVGYRSQYAELFLSKDSAAADTLYDLSYDYTYNREEIAIGAGHFWRTRPGRSFYLLGGGQVDLGTSVHSRMDMESRESMHFDEWSSATSSSWSGKAIGTTSLHAWLVGEVGFRIARRVEYGMRVMLGNGLRWFHGERLEFIPLAVGLGGSFQWVFRR